VILLPGLYVCAAHALRKFCHLINRSFVCKAKEGYIRIQNIKVNGLMFFFTE